MLEDIVQIRPQSRKSYYTGDLEFATPVANPKGKARHFFQWGLIYHAKGKPAEAYKYYEKAIIHHKRPLYLKQMGILHHEMGYFKDALKYLRTAHNIEKEIEVKKAREEAKMKRDSSDITVNSQYNYSENSTVLLSNYYSSSSQ